MDIKNIKDKLYVGILTLKINNKDANNNKIDIINWNLFDHHWLSCFLIKAKLINEYKENNATT